MAISTVKAAVVTMTEVGDKINEVKKKYEATVKIQVYTSYRIILVTVLLVYFIIYRVHIYSIEYL